MIINTLPYLQMLINQNKISKLSFGLIDLFLTRFIFLPFLYSQHNFNRLHLRHRTGDLCGLISEFAPTKPALWTMSFFTHFYYCLHLCITSQIGVVYYMREVALKTNSPLLYQFRVVIGLVPEMCLWEGRQLKLS